MKRIYFVRHSLTNQAMNKIHQGVDAGLSEEGVVQSETLAKKLRNLNIKRIISSNYKRALQTAEIVNNELKVEIETSELFREIRNPNEISGKSKEDKEVQNISKFIKENFHNLNIKFSDEEKYEEMLIRADKAIYLLEKEEREDILVVTHSMFLCVLLGRIVFKKNFTSHLLVDVINSFRISNAGISIFEINNDNFWNVITWNT